jgi:hypothetical protein
MAKDFAKTAEGILEGIGGMGNIRNVTHCGTFLALFYLISHSQRHLIPIFIFCQAFFEKNYTFS